MMTKEEADERGLGASRGCCCAVMAYLIVLAAIVGVLLVA